MKVEMNFGSNFAVMSFYKYINKRLYDQSFMLCKKKQKKTMRHRYHYSVRWCKKNKQQIQRSKLAENIGHSDTFWSELRKINPFSRQISETIGTAQGSSEISKLFFHKYKSLYNSVPTSDSDD